MRRTIISLLTSAVALAVLTVGQPAQAATYDGKITTPQAPSWIGTGSAAGVGSDTLTGRAWWQACMNDRILVAAGQKPTFVAAMIASPLNGLDGFVIDLKKETMGAFAVKGPGAKSLTPELPVIGAVPEYDMDMDFYTDPTVDATAAQRSGCMNANEKATSSSHKCYAHKPVPDEKTGCISGYKDSKGKLRGARYVLVTASLNLKGPFSFKLTAP